MDILDRNKKCPLCGKFYHRWDMHRNPIPTRKDQRAEESLCQCAKGLDARKFCNMRRMAIEEEQKRQKALREEWFNRKERNAAYWAAVQEGKQLRGGDKNGT